MIGAIEKKWGGFELIEANADDRLVATVGGGLGVLLRPVSAGTRESPVAH